MDGTVWGHGKIIRSELRNIEAERKKVCRPLKLFKRVSLCYWQTRLKHQNGRERRDRSKTRCLGQTKEMIRLPRPSCLIHWQGYLADRRPPAYTAFHSASLASSFYPFFGRRNGNSREERSEFPPLRFPCKQTELAIGKTTPTVTTLQTKNAFSE
jgi:hypothetical protein